MGTSSAQLSCKSARQLRLPTVPPLRRVSRLARPPPHPQEHAAGARNMRRVALAAKASRMRRYLASRRDRVGLRGVYSEALSVVEGRSAARWLRSAMRRKRRLRRQRICTSWSIGRSNRRAQVHDQPNCVRCSIVGTRRSSATGWLAMAVRARYDYTPACLRTRFIWW